MKNSPLKRLGDVVQWDRCLTEGPFGPQAKLVKQEQQAIDAQYEKKRKGAEVAQKMYVLTMLTPLRSKLKSCPAPIPP